MVLLDNLLCVESFDVCMGPGRALKTPIAPFCLLARPSPAPHPNLNVGLFGIARLGARKTPIFVKDATWNFDSSTLNSGSQREDCFHKSLKRWAFLTHDPESDTCLS